MTLDSSLTRLKGVGPVLEAALRAAGLNTVKDLLNYYPRKWDSYQAVDKIKNIRPGLVSFEASVEKVAMRRSQRHSRLSITEAILSDDTGTVKAIWFNQPYIGQALKPNSVHRFRGNYEYKNGYISLQSPTFEAGPINAGREDIVHTLWRSSPMRCPRLPRWLMRTRGMAARLLSEYRLCFRL